MGFTRRYPTFPSIEQIVSIEGVVIVDNAPPGTVAGINTGTVCCVGEFTDCTYAVTMSAAGIATTNPRAVQIFSGQSLIENVGGFDETLGDFGTALGNGFCSVRNKTYQQLVCTPVDIITPASGGQQGGIRVWRELPTNTSATDPTPIVPVSAAVVDAGREFLSSTNRVRVAQRVPFTDELPVITGVDGAYSNTTATTATFTSAGSDFTAAGVLVGDILVPGIIGTSLTGNSTQRRVTVVGTTTLTVQAMDGTSFTVTTEGSLPFRVHPAATADSAGSVSAANVVLSSTSGSTVIARPLDASITSATVLTPTVVPSAGTATSWEPLSGLTAYTRPTAVSGGNSLIYDANVHAPNAANNSTMDSRYTAALAAIIDDSDPAGQIDIVFAARKSDTIRTSLKNHVATASQQGLTRTCVISPQLSTVTMASVLSSSAPGVAATRSDRVYYAWPGNRNLVPEAIGFAIDTADSKTTTDGILDDTSDSWLAANESNLNPEFDPAQEQEPVPTLMGPIIGYQRGLGTLKLKQADYIALRAAGVVALKFAPTALFQSGVTSSLTSGEKLISRRRMTDFIQDSLAQRMQPYAKLPKTRDNKLNAYTDADAFLQALLSPDNSALQRIDAYSIDAKSGNTPTLDAAGIYVLIVTVRLLGEILDIVLNTTIGEGVTVTQVTT